MEWVGDDNVALFTDLYELTMSAAYQAEALVGPATFDLFVRHLPEQRRFLVACGIADALSYLEELRFTEADLAHLRSLGLFDDAFLELLAGLRFTGDVAAVAEGEVVFANEPILEVTAPLIEAQLVETFLLNVVGYQTLIATKAARVAVACAGRSFVDFSARRDHGADAALRAARAAYVGGATGTSLVVAGRLLGLPLSGTMAHAYVMAHEDEADAFRAFCRRFPKDAVLLIDTYDTLEGARRAVQVAHELEPEGVRLRGVRLDSGDLTELARGVRAILDAGGLTDVVIFASGDLDEYRIAELVATDAPVDAFGVGTQLGTSGDAPSLGVVYKLVEDATGPKLKLSPGKVTMPGRKQVFRVAEGGRAGHDVIALRDEEVAGGRPLLAEVMRDGRRLAPPEPLDLVRDRRRAAVEGLPARLLALHGAYVPYEVRVSEGLEALGRVLAGRHGPARP